MGYVQGLFVMNVRYVLGYTYSVPMTPIKGWLNTELRYFGIESIPWAQHAYLTRPIDRPTYRPTKCTFTYVVASAKLTSGTTMYM